MSTFRDDAKRLLWDTLPTPGDGYLSANQIGELAERLADLHEKHREEQRVLLVNHNNELLERAREAERERDALLSAVARIRARWDHIAMGRDRKDPGEPTCLRCVLEGLLTELPPALDCVVPGGCDNARCVTTNHCIAECHGCDLDGNPEAPACDCQNPDGVGVAHVSESCPVHNAYPREPRS